MSRHLRLPPTVGLAMHGLLIVACTMSDGPSPPEPWIDTGTSEDLLGYDVIPELGLAIAPDDVAALEREPRRYVRADLVFAGKTYGPVGVRVKGQNSFLPFSQKPSLRINVNWLLPDQTFHGLTDLTLNNMRSDASMMHERLAYRVARDAGLVASRANHLHLTVNGEPYGLYTNVETVKRSMFADPRGTLFEATDVDFTPERVDDYDLEAGPDDRSALRGLAEALARPVPADALAAAASFIDLAHFQQFWAMETIIGQFDAFPYSLPGDDYFVYVDPGTRRVNLVPWGMDESFLSAEFPPMQVNSKLATVCQAVPSCRQGYIDAVWALLAETEAAGLDAERARVQEQIAPYVAADARKPYTADDVAMMQTQLRYFIRGRREILTRNFPPPSR